MPTRSGNYGDDVCHDVCFGFTAHQHSLGHTANRVLQISKQHPGSKPPAGAKRCIDFKYSILFSRLLRSRKDKWLLHSLKARGIMCLRNNDFILDEAF